MAATEQRPMIMDLIVGGFFWLVSLITLAECGLTLHPNGARSTILQLDTSSAPVSSYDVMSSSSRVLGTKLTPDDCVILCAMDPACSRALFLEDDSMGDGSGSCYLPESQSGSLLVTPGKNEPTDETLSDQSFLPGPGLFVSDPEGIGKPSCCRDILAQDSLAVSGVYNVWPVGTGLGAGQKQRMWCDMETDGGGWTMVWSYYTLEKLKSRFTRGSNAVSPLPTWTHTMTHEPRSSYADVSTTPPGDLNQYGALDFSLWPGMGPGDEFMIKSNVNHWVACKVTSWSSTASFSRGIPGAVTCQAIRLMTNTSCPTLKQTSCYLRFNARGPTCTCGGSFYYFDGTVDGNYPTHDPCSANQVNGPEVDQPKGQLWLR